MRPHCMRILEHEKHQVRQYPLSNEQTFSKKVYCTTAALRAHNTWQTTAQQLMCDCITAVVRLTILSLSTTIPIFSNNLSYLLRQLILSFPTTISVISNRQSQYFQILSVFLSSFLLDSQNNYLSLRHQPDNNG